MSHYAVFWIKEEYAAYYFYKSGILYRFLKSYQQNKSNADLVAQYQYVTRSFPRKELINHLLIHHSMFTNIIRNDHQFELHKENSFVFLQLHQHHLTFYCETMSEAEDILFPILRLFHPYLFIIGMSVEDYGWLTPLRKNNLSSRQVLYSHL